MCRRKQEELERELEKYSLRRAPLGFDRHHRSYWWGLAGQRSAVYVQPEDGHLQVLRTPEELAGLMAGLDKRGVRELALFDALDKVPFPMPSILQVSSAPQPSLSEAGKDLRTFLNLTSWLEDWGICSRHPLIQL